MMPDKVILLVPEKEIVPLLLIGKYIDDTLAVS